MSRCDYCGRDQENARQSEAFYCAPPFTVQPHSFTGRHPADLLELTLEHIIEVNMQRCKAWHKGDKPWTPERWITAIVGELGEMANIVKKLFRADDGSVGILKGQTIEELELEEKKEWADTMLYMLLYAGHRGINPTEAIREVFNAKSEQLGFKERL